MHSKTDKAMVGQIIRKITFSLCKDNLMLCIEKYSCDCPS